MHCLGKSPPRHDRRTLLLTNFIDRSALQPSPASRDWGGAIKNWGMLANDQIGDCAIAGPAHLSMCLAANSGKPFIPTVEQVIADYSRVSGYNPQTGANDNGCVLLDVMNYWRTNGIAGHKITAYAAVHPLDHQLIDFAISYLGGCLIGVMLPAAAQRMNALWSVPRHPIGYQWAPGSWGGHAVPYVGQNETNGLYRPVSWGQEISASHDFHDRYCDECYVVLDLADWLGNNATTPSGLNLAALQADCRALGIAV
jgi:hypothetical protein